MSAPEMRMEIGMPTGLPVSSCRTSIRAPGTSRLSAVCSGPTSSFVKCLSLTSMMIWA